MTTEDFSTTAAQGPAAAVDIIQQQLDGLMKQRIDEIERNLEARINKERESARQKRAEVEGQFESEKEALVDFKSVVKSADEERKVLIEEIRERFRKILQYQNEIENLARSTGAEIKKVGELQKSLEKVREQTVEKGAALKKDLEDKFGIAAEIIGGDGASDIDLDRELERLRRIKDILAGEVAAIGAASETPLPGIQTPGGGLDGRIEDVDIPEIRDLITGETPAPQAEAAPAVPVEAGPTEAGEGRSPEAAEKRGDDGQAGEFGAFLAPFKKEEPTDGFGEIHYYLKDGKVVLDVEELIRTAGISVTEAGRLTARLEEIESPKEQFFVKQEIVNSQETLRGLLLRVVRSCEKSCWQLPPFTADLVGLDMLRDMLECLRVRNWSNQSEFRDFEGMFAGIAEPLRRRLEARGAYLASIKEALG